MGLTALIACLNVISLLLSYILLIRIMRKTNMKWRYIYLCVLGFLSIFRSIFIATDLGTSTEDTVTNNSVNFKCVVKAVLTVCSHYVRIIGLPLFVLATFAIILQNYTTSKINKMYMWLLMAFMASLVFVNAYYILLGRIAIIRGFCYLDSKSMGFVAMLNVLTTLFSLTMILGLSVIIYKKKRVTANLKYLVLASVYYSIIPLVSFFVYFIRILQIKKIAHLHAFQRITPFMIFLGVFLFERKTSIKKREILLKWMLKFKAMRDIYKNWLERNNFRKDYMVVELLEHVEENEEDFENINVEDYQRLFIESVKLENKEDLLKLKSELTDYLNIKYDNFKKASEYEQIQKIYQDTLDSDIALLDY